MQDDRTTSYVVNHSKKDKKKIQKKINSERIFWFLSFSRRNGRGAKFSDCGTREVLSCARNFASRWRNLCHGSYLMKTSCGNVLRREEKRRNKRNGKRRERKGKEKRKENSREEMKSREGKREERREVKKKLREREREMSRKATKAEKKRNKRRETSF